MGVVWVWTRCQWRRRLGGALAVTVLFALAVAVVLTAVAGARRTQTAYTRMAEAVRASDLLINPDQGIDTALDFDAVEALPGVEALGVAAGMYAVPADSEGRPDLTLPVLPLASADGEYGYTIDRPLLSAGRLPDPDAVDEVVIDPALAHLLDVSAGDATTLMVPDLSVPPTGDELPEFLPVEFTVTGTTFGASLVHLVDSPPLYGWNWDATLDAGSEPDEVRQALDADPRVTAWSPMTFNRLTVNGVPIPAVGVSPATDAITPTIVEGRPPTSGDEIVLGGRTMERLDVALGGIVTITSPDGASEELDLVGRAVFPGLGTYSGSERTELGTGAMTTIETLEAFGPAVDKGSVVIRLAVEADRASFGEDLGAVLLGAGADEENAIVTLSPTRPTDVVALGRVRGVPRDLVLLLAAMFLVQLVVAIFTAGRSRRHDLALLGTIGFVRRQVAATVCWQTITFVLIALVAGLPLGIAVGRALWTLLSNQLGVVPAALTPVATLLPFAAAILADGALISYAGGALLARTPPATALRSE